MIEKLYHLTTHPWWQYLQPMLVGLAVFLSAFLVRRVLLRRLQRWAEKTVWEWDDIVIEAIKNPSFYWCLIAGLYAVVVALPMQPGWEQLAGKLFTILWLISLTILTLRVADQMIRRYGMKIGGTLPLTSLGQNLAKAAIFTMGALMILNSLGVSITPILTALGVGGLAVALALQDTLANLFAGIYVSLARQIRVGDYIKLDSGEEGHITDIGWRSTRIMTLGSNGIVIPNTKIAQAIVTNFDLPYQDMAVLVEVRVNYGSDLEKVEKITAEVGRAVMKEVTGGVESFEPFIRYHTFADFSVNFTVILRAKTFVDQYLIKHEFIKRLHLSYAQEGIRIQLPTQMVVQEPPPAR